MISVIIPAFRAAATIERAVRSVIDQSITDWEAIIVADDDIDYAALLHNAGIVDSRLRFVSTGRVRSGCHHARNVGLALARGDFIAALDADDLFLPTRLETLLPLAAKEGAAADYFRVVDELTGQPIHRVFEVQFSRRSLDIAALLEMAVPLSPIIAREFAEPRLPGIEFGEDVVANLRLIDRVGQLTVISQSLSEYRIIRGALCHSDNSAEHFEQSYSNLIERLTHGDRLGLKPSNAAIACEGLIRKRELNRAFAAARKLNPALDFQTFAAAQQRG